MLGKISAVDRLIFLSRFFFFVFVFVFFFFQKTEFGISCELETICIKCQILFYGKNKKNIINLSSAEFAHSTVSVNLCTRMKIAHNKIFILNYFI